MSTCSKCGANLEPGALFCQSCGTPVNDGPSAQQTPPQPNYQQPYQAPQQPNYQQPNFQQPPQQPNFQQQPYQQAPQAPQQPSPFQQPPYQANQQPVVNNGGMIAWSIINLIFCCLPFGIWALVLATGAKNELTQADADDKLRKARNVNLAATIIGAVVIILYIVLYFAGVITFSSYYYYY